MRKWPSEQILASVRGFRLPRYGEIPDVGLYLEQVTRYLAACFSPLAESPLTPSMISNYVKRGLIANPVRKQYDRDRIAALIFISLAKTVLSLDDIRLLLRLQRDTYTRQAAYDYFCEALEGALRDVFGVEKPGPGIEEDAADEKLLLYNTIIAVAHKLYLGACVAEIGGRGQENRARRDGGTGPKLP